MGNHHFRNHFPLKLSRLFSSSLTSCKYQTLTDVAEASVNPITKPKKKFHKTDSNSSKQALLQGYYKLSDDEEDGNYKFFSSSSSHGDYFRRKKKKSNGQSLAKDEMSSGKICLKTGNTRRNIKKRRRKCFSVIEENYAVEKNSTDPYGDFLTSMVEMIVEKQIIGARDLEQLLICFLSLNQVSCHGIIFDVFADVCRTLFTN